VVALTGEKEWNTQNDHTWAVVLAAGDGKRLSTLTTDGLGRHVPKQFYSLNGEASVLDLALTRAHALVPQQRICAVVAKHHEHGWRPMINDVHSGNLIVQSFLFQYLVPGCGGIADNRAWLGGTTRQSVS
jgi:hypothetical protein